jgi:hypothetical protein
MKRIDELSNLLLLLDCQPPAANINASGGKLKKLKRLWHDAHD